VKHETAETSLPYGGAGRRVAPVILLSLILTLAAGLRFYGIQRDSLWTDEFLTLELSTSRGLTESIMPRDQIAVNPPHPTGLRDAPPWWRGWRAMDTDTHPPLHPMLLRFWRETFGEGDFAARSLSAVLSLLGVVFLFLAVRLVSGTSTGLWAALVMAVAPAQIDYAQFARSYSMLVTTVGGCCAAAVWVFVRGPSPWRCAVLGISMLIAMLTHYTAAGPLAGLALFLLLRGDQSLRKRVLLTVAVAAFVWTVIWGPVAFRQRGNFEDLVGWTREGSAGHLARTLLRLARLPMRYFFEPKERGESVAALGAILYVAPLLLVRRKPVWLMWWLVLIGAVLPVLIADLRRTSNLLAHLRYTIGGSVAVYAMVAAVGDFLGARLNGSEPAARWSRVLSIAAPLTVAIACLLTLPDFYSRRQPDFRDFGEFIAAHVSKNDLIVFEPAPEGAPWAPDILELAITHYADGAPCAMVILSREHDAAILSAIRDRAASSRGNIWLINSGTAGRGADIFGSGAKQLDAHYFHAVARVARISISN